MTSRSTAPNAIRLNHVNVDLGFSWNKNAHDMHALLVGVEHCPIKLRMAT